jgi:hypothetical protein
MSERTHGDCYMLRHVVAAAAAAFVVGAIVAWNLLW